MRRREFLVRSVSTRSGLVLPQVHPERTRRPDACERVLSIRYRDSRRQGIKTSRLAMGTGTVGSGHHSHRTV
jgi:hypothetical protein